jgi:adenylate kinase
MSMDAEPTYVIMMGPPASGKGTQAERLQKLLDLPHVASGDLFRYNLKNETELGLKAKGYMDKGELVPDNITIAMVLDRLAQPDGTKGALLDGFPRTVVQAEALDEALGEQGDGIDLVLNIQVPEEELIARVTGRRLCRQCGASYHVMFNPPREPDVCDKCGGELYQRDDDTEEVARKRLEVYEAQTKPLIDYYREEGLLVNIDGYQSIDEVTAELREAIENNL